MDLRSWLVERFKERRAWTYTELRDYPGAPPISPTGLPGLVKSLGGHYAEAMGDPCEAVSVFAVSMHWQPPAAPPESPAAREPEPEWVRAVREATLEGDNTAAVIAIRGERGGWTFSVVRFDETFAPVPNDTRLDILKALANSL